ncbi:uncharacterized protein DS421_20g690510 [Arachis hypogaea]|nr:uncharacterized protein DS421_20g690510 [Arachis hypogaea]
MECHFLYPIPKNLRCIEAHSSIPMQTWLALSCMSYLCSHFLFQSLAVYSFNR